MKSVNLVSILVLGLVLASCEPTNGSNQNNSAATSNAKIAADIAIPYEKFTLSNGLRVIVHTDRKAPIVNVNIWYHVGSKNEPTGKTGFAHLFEHLMFNGSENYDGEYFKPFEDVGVTGMNGTTWFDRTNYYETVPTPALEMALWMESDRMGHLLGAITQEKLDEQRAVVQNEKRQGDNRPYGMVEYSQLEGLYPVGHPYRHSTIGSMDDLDAASLDDVHSWFKQYYGASNAVLVLSGDIDAAAAKPLVEKYFGDVEAGPALNVIKSWVPELANNVFEEMQSDVPQQRIYRSWPVPARSTQDLVTLDLVSMILGSGKNSRLYKRLVADEALLTTVSASVQAFELTSVFEIQATLANDADAKKVEAIIDEVIADFMKNGPTADELSRVVTRNLAHEIRSLEGVGAKAAKLATGELYAADPIFFKTQMNWMSQATTASVKAAAARWLDKGFYQLTVTPYAGQKSIETTADRSKLPEVTTLPELVFPPITEGSLSNGIRVVLAERNTVPQVQINMQFNAGTSADTADAPGAALFTMGMLDEGTVSRSASEITDEAEALGAQIFAGANGDMSNVSINALTANLDASLALFADIVQNPSFDAKEMDRVRKARLAAIAQTNARPISGALNILFPALYGEGHAYAQPNRGAGTEDSVAGMTADQLRSYYKSWIRADNATIFISGNTTLGAIIPALEATFGSWAAPATPMATKNVGAATAFKKARVILVDKPGAPQSLILAGQLVSDLGDKNSLIFDAANDIFGGQFTARLNMNLREDKGWSYGAQTLTLDTLGERPWIIYAPVQTDKTKESLQEIVREVAEFLGSNPAKADELDAVIKSQTRSLPGRFETAGAVLGSMVSNNRFGRRLDYATTLKAQYDALSLEDVNAEANVQIKPEELVWIIVGDVAKIEEGVKSLGLGFVEIKK